ncbi:DNA polymerase III subunit alpha [Eoetvoesiella caeni]|uniref:DNA polymerase III subunit alpha n=1 Tax=Eoetvoesiella caeni TaxID=645616 RepID=A0A366H5U2_9BURK|nr:DNA polymerase III subunit alpha [Eoetvoesiella caeni]MCI2810064.1 DNA polymerase III subunit alpha [Eoetvoesiella caeni]NYT55936.1 DNA polymerase III subunit alpha [Eoetvoesiella caeni]RBP37451.1 DNA polymerase III alpha subunit [Eoetvoesiella caeni]
MTDLNTSLPFVHLRVHSEFSVVDGIVQIPALIKKVAEYGQPAVALTDLSNIFGLIKFYKSARKGGVKPIAGCDIWVQNETEPNKPHRLLLLVSTHQGYLNLCDILTRSWLDNQHMGRAEVRSEWLQGRQGLIVLSGGRGGDVGQALESGRDDEARMLARRWAGLFPGSYYIELQRSGAEGDEAYVQAALRLAGELDLPVVATHPVQFIDAGDFRAHEARVCISEGEQLANPKRVRRFTQEQYLLNSQEMTQRFADVPSALANTVEIARRCNLTLHLGTPYLPNFPTPEGVTLDDYLVQLSEAGLEKRMLQLFPDEGARSARQAEYKERLAWECKTIIEMGFPGYFLIVADFINWGKNNGVPVGPGRGSGAGSLVAYSLGITDLDPIQYDLLFERFLNPERVSMPDFDIDFCQDNRERVIDYVKQKYGKEAVSQIATFGTLGAKAVVRDVGRVLEMPYSLCDSLSKLIPFSPADPWTLERTLADEPAFKERYEQDEEVRALIDLARPLEGLTRNIGMHAGGVLIAPGKLTDFCPLYCQPGVDSNAVSQFDKDDVEAAGLVKFDFLGLRNLTILDWAVRYVRRFNEDKRDFDIMSLPLNDLGTYRLLSEGNTTAVFQLESRGMKELLKNLQPNTFEDVIAVLALFRPGPLESGMVLDFVNRKHGRAEVDYFHPDLEPVLKSTYGVIVYQEQVMLISQIIGGYTLGGADMLRRAMGKKKPEEMAKHRAIFEEGAVKKGYDAALAVKLFDLMEKFAGYGFNKSHSAAYALIAYQTAWLKAYHPAEFLAGTLSSDMDDTDKVQIFWKDALANGVEVLPPDVNESNYRFEPVADRYTAKGQPPRTMRYGLGAVKGAGQAAVEEIIRVREQDGPYTSLFDFCRRVDRHMVNRRTIEALIRAGAFDRIDENRAAVLATISTAIEAAEQAERSANQVSLFADDSNDIVEGVLANVAPWDLHTRLTQEKAALGFFFSAHLFDSWRDEVRRFAPKPLARLEPARGLQWFAGVLSSVRVKMTRRGKMLYALLDDGSAQVEVAIFNELYEQHRNRLKEDKLVIIHGKVSNDDYSGGLRVSADQVYDLQLAREERARALSITLNGSTDAARLRQLLNPFRAEPENGVPGVPVEVRLKQDGFLCTVRLGEEWRVRMADVMLDQLGEWVKPEGVEIRYT